MINLIVACGEDRVIGKMDDFLTIQEDWDYLWIQLRGSMIMGKSAIKSSRSILLTGGYCLTKVRHSLLPCPDRTLSGYGNFMATRQPIWICGGEAVYRKHFLCEPSLFNSYKKKFEGMFIFLMGKHISRVYPEKK